MTKRIETAPHEVQEIEHLLASLRHDAAKACEQLRPQLLSALTLPAGPQREEAIESWRKRVRALFLDIERRHNTSTGGPRR